jgi:hypothetical protein
MSIDPNRLPATAPDRAAETPDADYDDYVREAIAEGLENIRAGRVTPVEQIWKKLGLE